MHTRIHKTLTISVVFSLLIYLVTAFGCSRSDGLSLEDIPRYPNATEVETMEQSSFGGIVGGSLVQFTTNDTYDEVLDFFYTDALKMYDPEVLSHVSELGRQTAISIPQKNGTLSVAIQEFTEEGRVNITFMRVGN